VLYPNSRVLSLIVVVPVKIPAWVYLAVWALYQLIEGNYGLFSAHANGGGVAFFAHVGGFTFGLLVTLSGLPRGLFSRNQAYGLSGSAVNSSAPLPPAF
jgi:membrane associated rhomboid family serine protease